MFPVYFSCVLALLFGWRHGKLPGWLTLYWLLATDTEWYRTKPPMQLQPFADLLCFSSQF
jgi:hypothetical protein